MPLEKDIHRAVSGIYSRKSEVTQTFRQAVSSKQSFSQQYNIGREVVKKVINNLR